MGLSFYFIISSNLNTQINKVSLEIEDFGFNKDQQPISLKLGVIGDTHTPENNKSYTELIKVLSEINRTSSILRDIFDDSFKGIFVDDKMLLQEVKEYLDSIAPNKKGIVSLYKDSIPIFEKFGIERQIKTSFGKTVSMKKGAYLVIEHTEALHVIDVNSGNRSNKEKSQEEAAQ